MRLLLLNQYGPASGAPTGRILSELGSGLQRLGHEVSFLEVDAAYGQSRRGLARILHEAGAHVRLLLGSVPKGRVDAVISLTSPACLAVTAGVISRLLGARHFHWAMDVYPEVGVRLGELPGGVVPQILTALMRRAYRRAQRVVALDEDMREHLHRAYGIDAAVMEPFPPDVEWTSTERTPETPRRWLYSGNLGRAHEIDVLLEVQKKLEERNAGVELVLQGHGAQFGPSQEAADALGLRQVQWRPQASAEALGQSLLQADVLVVTRKAELKGLLLPSKLMLAELSGRPILWIGDTDGFTARRLKKAGHGVFGRDEIEPMAEWLAQTLSADARPPGEPRPSSGFREQGVAMWHALLREK